MTDPAPPPPPGSTAVLVLASGRTVWGRGLGASGHVVGEVCFNTSMTGYQEILTDPSYAGQIITFTFPHVGNVGTNEADVETTTAAARGLIVREDITDPSNYRSTRHLDAWLKSQGLIGLAGVDTREITRLIRDAGAPTGVLAHAPDGNFDLAKLMAEARAWPGLEGMDLAKDVSCRQSYGWDETTWTFSPDGYGKQEKPVYNVVAVDYGAKRNILRCLAASGCKVTVVPANATAEDVLRHKPDGVFLSNGPGDPEPCDYAINAIRTLVDSGLPVFGICLGHQLLGLASGARTMKMKFGHHGANHPVQDLADGRVMITSQNHGFAVDEATLPATLRPTHRSLFDGSLQGIHRTDRPAFSFQGHPEASPGPHDAAALFDHFIGLMREHSRARG